MIFLNVVIWAFVVIVTVAWLVAAIGFWFEESLDGVDEFSTYLYKRNEKKRMSTSDSTEMPREKSPDDYVPHAILLGSAIDFGFIVWIAGVVQVAYWAYGGK